MFDVSPIAPDSMVDEVGRLYYFSEKLDAGGDSKQLDQGDQPTPAPKPRPIY